MFTRDSRHILFRVVLLGLVIVVAMTVGVPSDLC